MIAPLRAAACVLGAFCVLLVALAVYRRRYSPHPEALRKVLHVGMGMVTITLPWLFQSTKPVLLLTGVFIVSLVLLRFCPLVRTHFGVVIHGVNRVSLGDICFAAGAGAVFLLASGDLVLFYVPMLVLALADAASGLVGLRYGRWRYPSWGEAKTVEGSVAFFAMAFLSTTVALRFLTDTPAGQTLLVSLLVAFFVMLLEAVIGYGVDNLAVPLGTFVFLKTYLRSDASIAAALLASGVVVLMIVLARKTHPSKHSLAHEA